MSSQHKNTKHKMSNIVKLHYIKFTFRLVLFLSALCLYLYNRICKTGMPFGGLEDNHLLLSLIWLCFFIEMLFRFFPSKLESIGCQKHLSKNFEKTDVRELPRHREAAWRTFWAAISWIVPNAVFSVLYLAGVFDTGLMVLLALCYSVCDVICILFFCPFQTWILKNKCCVSCRIYNWDYVMMFTPFIFIKNVYTWSLLCVALILLLHWEFVARRHPERFCEETNGRLSCRNCKEVLCHHKKQLRFVWKKGTFNLRGNTMLKKEE